MIGYACTADEGHPAINHQQFAMRAIIGTDPVPHPDGVVPLDFASGIGQFLKEIFGRTGASQRVNHDFDLDAGARPLRESAHHLSRDFPTSEDVCLPINAVLGRGNGREFRWIEVLGVRDQLDGIALRCLRERLRLELAHKLRIGERLRAANRNLVGQGWSKQRQKQPRSYQHYRSSRDDARCLGSAQLVSEFLLFFGNDSETCLVQSAWHNPLHSWNA